MAGTSQAQLRQVCVRCQPTTALEKADQLKCRQTQGTGHVFDAKTFRVPLVHEIRRLLKFAVVLEPLFAGDIGPMSREQQTEGFNQQLPLSTIIDVNTDITRRRTSTAL